MTAEMTFEDSFARCPSAYRLGFDRERVYDSEYGIFYSQGRHRPIDVEPGPKPLPGRAWVRDALATMVVGEGVGRVLPRPAPSLDRLHGDRRVEIEAFPIERYIEICEEEYVFGGLADNLIGSADTPKAERFLSLISNRWLGSPVNRRNVTEVDVASPLERADEAQAPIQLLLPAMPFKDQCAFRTDSPADHVDLGEIAFLVRLHCLALAVNQMHEFDSECVIISDGTVYASMFGVAQADAVRYLDHLRHARDRLNLAKSIHIVELGGLVGSDDRYRQAIGYPTHRVVRNRIKREIRDLIASDAAAAAAFRTLAFGMRWNLNSRRYVESGEVTTSDLWRWLRTSATARGSGSSFVPPALTLAADDAALEYAAFNLSISYTRLLSRYFPDAIRLTSHSKAGQVMAPRIGHVFPWNGVAHSDAFSSDTVKASSIRSVELHSVLTRRLLPVFERNGRYPICYTEEGAT